ncbi:ferrochelatase [Corynebacterium sp. CNJ-954]|uniref:ferrochelatase n=1 Tax=Corynebacterium sp. CNJ-954 TaxID=1904962 RepID=UPI00095FCD74|nr:ferrochelatase [Corynebacterium sp. CNJ-954]OLT55737.1 ferrochelatase [Corynebacterium sp. CNJ-954]
MSGTHDNTAPTDADALLLLSFGGPEQEADVIPFLENVTKGRGIPRERLKDVGEHYYALGGRSPLNDLNREMIAGIRAELDSRGSGIPIYFGNRNWHPFVEDAVETMARDGVRSAVVFATSAWGGYSGCRQYHEDIARARQAVVDAGLTPPRLRRLPQFHDHPLFIDAFARAVDTARATLDEAERADLVFTAHSIPLRADAEAGPPELGGHLYSRQVRDSAELIRDRSSFGEGTVSSASSGSSVSSVVEADVVWQSRSGPPSVPWLEPDICDHLRARVDRGNTRPVVLCPVGFLSDHVEVLWDLDTEASETAEELGIDLVRATTPGSTSDFAAMVVDLVQGATRGEPGGGGGLGRVPNFGSAVDGAFCAVGCCGG